MNALPLLPVGYNTFDDIRRENALYVDKTGYLTGLRKLGKVIFCARPRRFGKSLTVSTLDAFYSGKKDLFRGLAAEQAMNTPGFEPHPVLRLDMSVIAGRYMKESLNDLLSSAAARYNLEIRGGASSSSFLLFIGDICRSAGKQVALLIDEYDAPVLNAVYSGDPKHLADTREFMRGLYTQIKAADEFLHFTFLTGVSKFTRMGVFSSLNNITDISLMPEYAGFMGITHVELKVNFAAFIEKRAKDFGLTSEEMARRIQEYYDGFSFDGNTRVYNPFSTLQFFNDNEPLYRNYWMESGSASFVRNFLKDKKLSVEEFRNIRIGQDAISDPVEIEHASPPLFLHQAGYLTLRRIDGTDYVLDYPNTEVLNSLSRLFIENFYQDVREVADNRKNFLRRLEERDVPGIADELRRLYGGISYSGYANAEKKRLGEAFYRDMLQCFIRGTGLAVGVEVHNNLGRMDVVVEYAGRTFVFELKATDGEVAAEKAAEAGMSQMRGREYGNAFPDPILICLAMDETKRNIGACRWEEAVSPVQAPDEGCNGPAM